jgi:hypothetical protein
MADWINCPGCGLKHSRRPDGTCPRCKQSVDGPAAAMAAAAAPAAAVPARPMPDLAAPRPAVTMAGLGDLAQSARGKQLKNARAIMFFVGALSVAVNLFVFMSAESEVQHEIDKEVAKLGPGMVADPDKIAEVKAQAVGATHLMSGAGMLLGGVFIACGLLVTGHPVPATITALALYLGSTAIFGLINPASIASGLLVKIFIALGLFKAVQAAIAYQKELAAVPGI